jgi:hypothetical protein
LKNGPRVPQNVLMSHLIVDGVIGPGWPVGLDFQLAGPGSVTLDITTADKVQYHQVLTNDLNGRGITITYPDGLPDKVQSATFDVEAAAPAGSNGAAPNLRVYGIAAGPKAVGSIAIDEVTFGPSAVKMKQAAQYGFHSHSDFSDVRADFMFTGLKDNHIVMKQDNETPLGNRGTAPVTDQGLAWEQRRLGGGLVSRCGGPFKIESEGQNKRCEIYGVSRLHFEESSPQHRWPWRRWSFIWLPTSRNRRLCRTRTSTSWRWLTPTKSCAFTSRGSMQGTQRCRSKEQQT